MKTVELDQRSKNIILVMVSHKKEYRSNELYKLLHSLGYKMSKPTYIKYMNQLTELGILEKEVIRPQLVNYRLNTEKYVELRKTEDHIEFLKEWHKDLMSTFKELSIEHKVEAISDFMSFNELYKLKLRLMQRLKPLKKLEYTTSLLIVNGYFNLLTNMFLDSLSNDELDKAVIKTADMAEYKANTQFIHSS